MKKWLKRARRSAALVLMLGVMMLPREEQHFRSGGMSRPRRSGIRIRLELLFERGRRNSLSEVSIPLSFFLPTGRTLIVLITIKVPRQRQEDDSMTVTLQKGGRLGGNPFSA